MRIFYNISLHTFTKFHVSSIILAHVVTQNVCFFTLDPPYHLESFIDIIHIVKVRPSSKLWLQLIFTEYLHYYIGYLYLFKWWHKSLFFHISPLNFESDIIYLQVFIQQHSLYPQTIVWVYIFFEIGPTRD